MASAAEQLASTFNFGAFSKATELKKRLWFTLGALIVYRLGTYIPLPGIDSVALAATFNQHRGGMLDMFNMFSGGALERMTIFALNIMPYISASIIMQLMTAVSPKLEALKKEGESGRKKINQYTRYGTVLLATVQGFGIASGLEAASGSVVVDPGYFFRATTVISLVGGTVFLMWLGEQITQRGVGNGISLIIFSGIVANLPVALVGTLELGRTGALSTIFIIFLLFKMFGGESSHLPLKLNTAGVIPPIFASSILFMPATIVGFSGGEGAEWLNTLVTWISPGQPLYLIIYVAMIVFFAFFYTAIVFNPGDTADNLKKYGGFIPGIRPGKNTSDYLDFVLTRLTFVGAAYLSLVCILPEILRSQYAVPFYFGGTSLLIVVSVTMDTVAQIHSHMLAHQYEGLIKKSKLRGRRR